MIKKRYVSYITTALLLMCLLTGFRQVQAQEPAANAINSAKQQIVTCYQAAAEAERAGAEVASLTVPLNDAGLLLSQAELAYSRSDFALANDLASQSYARLNGFVDEAAQLKAAGEQAHNMDFLINVVGSIVGTFAVIGASVGIWIFLKRRYGQTEEQADANTRV